MWIAVGLAMSLLLFNAAQAQTPVIVPTPAQLVPNPPPARAEEGLPSASPPRELGKPVDDLRVDVDRYNVADDAPPELRAALARLTAPYIGPDRSFEDLVGAANEVTRFLQRDLGYYLGYAYIPEQVMDGRQVRIAVLEGRLDHVVLNWRDDLPVRREQVQAYLDRLRPGAILTVQEVERAVFLVNDLRGIAVRTEVRAGSQPGTATLVFTPKAEAHWSSGVDADINGSRFIGAQRLGVQLAYNSPLAHGDGLSASLLGSTTGGLRFGLIGYTTPLGGDGFKAGLSVSALQYQLDRVAFPLGFSGSGRTVNVFGLYPWVRSRNLNLFALGAANDKLYIDDVAALSKRKRVNDLTLGLNGDFRDSLLTGGVNTFDLNMSVGRLKFPAGTPSGLDDALNFSKINGAYSRLQNIIDGRLQFYLNARGQWSFHNLDTTEQFRAGGPDGVRAFAPGEGTGDSGLVTSTELRWLPPAQWAGKWSRELVLGLFYDAAYIQLRHDPDQIVRASDYVNHNTLAGGGLSLVWARPGEYALRLSVAKPTEGQAKSDTQERAVRVYAQGSFRF